LPTFRLGPRWVAVLGLAALAASTGRTPATNPPAARAGYCNIRVIVAFSPAMARAPDDGFLKDVARAAGVELVFVSTIAPNLHVFTLSAADGESGCHGVVEGLRRDSRVRSVDIDTRRQHH
jgi:hypothetical protein